MRLTSANNLDQVFAQLDRFADDMQRVAAVRAVNKLADQAQTAGFREIAKIYDIGPRVMENYASIRQAGAELEATITVKGKGFPLSEFKPIRTRKGISVKVKGRRVLIPHTFFTPKTNQRVFARGGYGGKGVVKPTGESFGRFAFGRSRLPINQLWTLGPATAFANDDVTNAMQDRVEEQAGKVLASEIRFARGGR